MSDRRQIETMKLPNNVESSPNGNLDTTLPSRRHSARISTSIFTSTVADALCEEAFERLDNVNDVTCATAPLNNGESGDGYGLGDH